MIAMRMSPGPAQTQPGPEHAWSKYIEWCEWSNTRVFADHEKCDLTKLLMLQNSVNVASKDERKIQNGVKLFNQNPEKVTSCYQP
jgi:hypothetical protein